LAFDPSAENVRTAFDTAEIGPTIDPPGPNLAVGAARWRFADAQWPV
jgi:hypothetical protein